LPFWPHQSPELQQVTPLHFGHGSLHVPLLHVPQHPHDPGLHEHPVLMP
jgi:hypothetical protein